MGKDKRKDQFFALMARYNELGQLLPDPDAFDTDDAAAIAEAKLVMAEMAEVQHAIDDLLAAKSMQ